MAKDKNKEAEYKAEGLRRSKVRKEERKKKYVSLILKRNEVGGNCSLSAVRYNTPWRDSSSPTGWKQICSYQGHCEFPCNGDC